MRTLFRTFAPTIALTLSFALLSCDKKIPEEDISKGEPETEEFLMPAEIPEVLVEATILTDREFLCLYGRDMKMHKIRTLYRTNTVSIPYKDNASEFMMVGETIYYKAVYDNCDYWIDGTRLAFCSSPALIISKAFLYVDKDLQTKIDGANSSIGFGKFISVSNDEAFQSEHSIMIYFFDSAAQELKSAWIEKGLASTREDDLVVMQVVNDLKVTKRATPRNELFKKAARYKPCPQVTAALNDQMVERIENNYQDVLNALPGAKYKVNVPELLTVDQSKDPFQ